MSTYIKRDYKNWSEKLTTYSKFIMPLICTGVESIADIGAGSNMLLRSLKDIHPGIKTFSFDQTPLDPDVVTCNLNNPSLPFSDHEIDIAVCSHVLEHVDNPYALICEVLRISKTSVIILPNPLNLPSIYRIMRGLPFSSMYGLPSCEQPLDRHKWAYVQLEAEAFIYDIVNEHGLHVSKNYIMIPSLYAVSSRLSDIKSLSRIIKQAFVHETAFVLKK